MKKKPVSSTNHHPDLAALWMASSFISELMAKADPEALAQGITEQVRELTGAQTVLLLAHSTGGCSLLQACPPRRSSLFSIQELEKLCPFLHQKTSPLLIDEWSEDAPLKSLLSGKGVRSVLNMPLMTGGNPVGTIVLLNLPEPDRLDDVNQILEMLAPFFAVALSTTQKHELATQRATTLEEEIEIRTAEIKEARLAALNMMEDAVQANERLADTARFPAENTNPVLRISKDFTLLYRNTACDQLEPSLAGIREGERVPEIWSQYTQKTFLGGKPHETELKNETHFFSVSLVPNTDRGYINVYAKDITKRKQQAKSLKESEEKMRTTLKSIGDAVISTDASGRVELMNPVAEALTGWTSAEATGKLMKDVFSIFNEKTGEPIPSPVDLVFESGQIVELASHTVLRSKDGKEIPIADSGAPIKDADGTITGAVLVFRDQTAERANRNALEENEARFRNLLQNMKLIPVQGYNARREVIYWNAASERVYGYSEEEALGRKIEDLIIPPEMRADVARLSDAWHAGGAAIPSAECILQNKAGQPVQVFSSHVMHITTAGKHEMFCIDVDLRDLKSAEDQMRESRNLLRTVVDAIPSRIWWKDRYSVFMGANILEAETPEDLVGKTVFDLYETERAEQSNADDAEVMETGHPKLGLQERITREDGTIAWFETNKIPLRDSAGLIIGTVGISTDITENKRMQEAIEKRIVALTRPLGKIGAVEFEELFDINEIQRLQDEFSNATGTAAVIVSPDGTPITQPSNFSDLCQLIHSTEKGCANCQASDESTGAYHPGGPFIQPCLSGGLWDAGANIMVGDTHIASWLVGQVRNEEQTEEQAMAYAREIGVDETAFLKAYKNVPQMSRAHFEKISQAVYTMANQLSNSAHQNIQQARFIAKQEQADRVLNNFFDQPMNLNLIASFEGIIGQTNRGWNTHLGYVSDDLTGQNLIDFVHPDERVSTIEQMSGLSQGEVISNFKNRYRHKDGTYRTLEWSAVPSLKDQQIYAVGNDVTERDQAEHDLHESQAYLAAMWTAMDIGIALIDAETKHILRVNPALLRLGGFEEQNLIGEECFDTLCPACEGKCPVADLGENLEQAEKILVCADGTRLDVEKSVTPLMLNGREVFLETLIDITERKAAEAELRRLSTAIEQSPETIVITDAEGVIQYANPAFETVTGYSPLEALGQNPSVLKSGKHPEEFYADMWQTISSGKIWAGRIINKCKDDSLFTEEATISPVRDPQGQITNYVAVKRDISDELIKEEEFRQVQKMDAIGQLASGVAHDFNNIIQGIQSFSELLEMNLKEDTIEYFNATQILISAQRATKLTRQLLNFSSQQPIQPEEIDLNDAIHESEGLMLILLGEMFDFVLELDESPLSVFADPGQLSQIIMNLSVNARDAMPDGGQLIVSTCTKIVSEEDMITIPRARPGTFACLSVADNGCGIDAKILDRIFDPFFTTKEVGSGTGLGLSVIFGIVNQCDGWINVYSEKDLGTTFKIYLPLILPEGQGVKKLSQPIEHPADRRILLIEDDPNVANKVIRILSAASYNVMASVNAEDGLRVFKKEQKKFDLLISDRVLPDMDGSELAGAIRKIDPTLPIMLLSDDPDPKQREEHSAKTDYYIVNKPFTAEHLAATVKRVFND